MNKPLTGSVIRHLMSSGGWLVFLLVFLPPKVWYWALENVQTAGKIGSIIGGTGLGAALVAHFLSGKNALINKQKYESTELDTNPYPPSDRDH